MIMQWQSFENPSLHQNFQFLQNNVFLLKTHEKIREAQEIFLLHRFISIYYLNEKAIPEGWRGY